LTYLVSYEAWICEKNTGEHFKRYMGGKMSKTTRCRVLNKLAKQVMPVTMPPLKAVTVHKQSRLK
jgi:hypothetical protein